MDSDSAEENNSAYLLDIRNLAGKYSRCLGDHSLDKKLNFHRLSSLHDTVEGLINATGVRPPYDTYLPYDGGLDDILPIVVDHLQYLCCFPYCFRLDWKVKLDMNLLHLKV